MVSSWSLAHHVIELHARLKPEPLIYLHCAGVIVANLQKGTFTSGLDEQHKRGHQCRCVSAAEVLGMGGHRGARPITGDVQTQPAQGPQLRADGASGNWRYFA